VRTDSCTGCVVNHKKTVFRNCSPACVTSIMFTIVVLVDLLHSIDVLLPACYHALNGSYVYFNCHVYLCI